MARKSEATVKMEYDFEKVKSLIEDLLKIPTVKMSKDCIPYEYMESVNSRNVKTKRIDLSYLKKAGIYKMPYDFSKFCIDNEISKRSLEEFASGVLLNYIDRDKIYG